MEAPQFTLRSGIGALHAALRLPQLVEERKLDFGGEGLLEDACFGHFHASMVGLRVFVLRRIKNGELV